ncbi:metalloprotease FTSH [Seminavis robusta]|uniref:Metalloprotease FTSH n=1 Tax=Seminavis robusta TaxID=568900 RepID=A0A9N8DI65_9STRA|nr:metalloprotease FTSH [Seminavis robusta]|eukprot:Sro99_g050980.1 metalloprotease FTSH (751) ;mRNA; f:80426-82824
MFGPGTSSVKLLLSCLILDLVASSYDFEAMTKLVTRLNNIQSVAPETMLGFYEPELKSFSVKPEVGREGENDNPQQQQQQTCITSSCYALLTLILSADVYESTNIPIADIFQTMLQSPWRQDDLFQVPLLLYTLLRVDTDRSLLIAEVAADPNKALKIKKSITAVLKAAPDPRLGTRQVHSDYISYQVCKVLALLQETTKISFPGNNKKQKKIDLEVGVGGLPLCMLPDELSSEILRALMDCAEMSCNELCRQLAYRTAGDRNSFDVVRLAYSLLTYVRSTTSLTGTGISGRELEPGRGPSADTKVVQLNDRLVKAALGAFFDEQNSDGLWDKGQPIYSSFRRQGRNMGNAFVFSVNTVGSLLCLLSPEDFRPHLGALERTLSWIENHQMVEVITSYCDPVSGQCYGRPLRGWSSPHSPDSSPQAWPTAQVLKCAAWMRTTIRQLIHNDVIDEFHGIRFSELGIQPKGWDRLLDSDLGILTERGKPRTIKSVLKERVITPFASSMDNPSYGAAYSAVLFGPPGTAKTTICEALAQRMGFDFCVIDTSAFLADGLSNVAARIRYVFRRLMALNQCVILFDEIEEFALDRETPGLSMESRMLTTAMLTAINDLRRAKQSIFFIATNRLRAFDAAITRRGRFDMQLFVGTPNLESRMIQFQKKLEEVPETKKVKTAAVQTYRKFLESEWSNDAMYMNYLEGMQFASACARIVASRRQLTVEELSSIHSQQAAVMTVRRSVRDEFVASMGLTRL